MSKRSRCLKSADGNRHHDTAGPPDISIPASIAEFERELVQDRIREGRKRAVSAGVKFGPKFKLDSFQRASTRPRSADCRGHDRTLPEGGLRSLQPRPVARSWRGWGDPQATCCVCRLRDAGRMRGGGGRSWWV